MIVKHIIFSIFIILFSVNPASAKVYYQTNNVKAFSEEYASYNYSDLIAKGKARTIREEYFLSYAYLRNKNNVFEDVDYCKAMDGFKIASKNDVADASYVVAIMYYNGLCVDQDLEKARKYLILSGSRNYVQAQALLGRAYWGENVRDLFAKDTVKARHWLEKAANNGDAPSAIGLSYLYEHGLGGDENPELAFKWRRKASSLPYGEFAMAYFQPLARYYENGYGTEADLVQAYKYYDLSGSVGGAGRSRVSKKMTNEQIAEARQQSRHWQEENRRFNPGYNSLQHQPDGSYR
ncbi:tetratricopeptide repeat protein [Cobetia amphilecti]|uniref:tetratricopeptide repeat protein n=1 Tax=Cobetia amphilecti TaxID=1055104 RepID=UPI001C0A370E|nr:tetratricopeptide repeat protein [Cobetia amphilecti]MBU3009728.1 sel1 repeat family protein [Cobetia amphilecti]